MQLWTSLQQRSLTLRVRLRQQQGQSMVEFAFVFTLILLPIILGILYFGRYEDYSNQETQLAEMGARWAAVNANPGATTTPVQTLQAYIQSQAQPELRDGSADVVQAKVFLYYPSGSTNTVGSSLRACVVTTFSLPTPLVTIHPGPLAQSATMRIEQAQTAAKWTPDSASTAQAAGCP